MAQRTSKQELVNQIEHYDELEELARRARWLAISTVAKSGAGHVGGPFSAMDLLIALYFRVMKVDPQNPRWPERNLNARSIHFDEKRVLRK